MDAQTLASGNDGLMGSYSEAASSPQGSLSYASSTGYSTGNTSFNAGGQGSGMDFDLNSLFNGSSGGGSTNGDSPPFDFGNSLVCDFDTSGLQGLFSQQAPLIQPQFQQPFQGLSPSSTMSATSPPNSYPVSNNYPPQLDPNASSQPLSMYPSHFLAPSQAPTYPTPARNPSISSAASPSSITSVSLVEPEASNPKRRRVTLAETAGLAPHQHQLHSSSSIAPAPFTVKPDVYSHLASSSLSQSQVPPTSSTLPRKQKAKSPVELIANAGMANAGVYNPRKLKSSLPPCSSD
jgi:hypothetical protein